MQVLVLGASGTAGQAAASALAAAGHELAFVLRPGSAAPVSGRVLGADPTDPVQFRRTIVEAAPEAIVSCLASRTGTAKDAWAIDHDAHVTALEAAKSVGARHFVLVSALCVQRPMLEFQRAKLAFESRLTASGLTYSIVRPTAFFKSLSGQVSRVQAGKPFLVFGDGRLTACKPISDRDMGVFIAECLKDPQKHSRILPIGGPGPALTPLDQVAILSDLLGREVPVRRVPVTMMSAIIGGLSLVGRISMPARDRAEFARIGRYYGTESMLLWDGTAYSAEATPEFGSDTLRDHYSALLAGDADAALGAHGAF